MPDWNRLDDLAARITKLEDVPTVIVATQIQVEALATDVAELRAITEVQRKEAREDVKALRAAIIGFALTVAGTGVGAAVMALLGVFGHVPH